MNDDDLRKLLRNSLGGRQTPAEVRERLLQVLRPRSRWALGSLAAAVLLACGASLLVLSREARPNPSIARAIEQHMQSRVHGHAVGTGPWTRISQPTCSTEQRDRHGV